MASVASGDFPHASYSSAMGLVTNALVDRFILKKTASGGSNGLLSTHNMHSATTATTTTSAHTHPPPSQHSFNKHHRGDSNNSTPRDVEFASHTHTYPIHQNDPSHYSSTSTDTQDIDPASASASDRSRLNDMGPPLSRTLLLVATAAANGETTDHRHAAEGSYSRAGSVRSFSTGEAPSDVVAHVDTDDCGGSINLVRCARICKVYLSNNTFGLHTFSLLSPRFYSE